MSPRPDFDLQLDWQPGPPTPLSRHLIIDWLMAHVVVAPNGCWLWSGADSGEEGRGAGYAKVKVGGKTFYLHRLVYHFMKGAIPKGYQIDHECKHWNKSQYPFSHRRCVNPDHLKAMTQADNIKRNNFTCQTEMGV